MSKKRVVIKEENYEDSIYNTNEWNKLPNVDIKKWEHDYVKKEYIIDIYKQFLTGNITKNLDQCHDDISISRRLRRLRFRSAGFLDFWFRETGVLAW